MDPQSSTEALIAALRVLATNIRSDDGVANAAIAEAATRMETMLGLIDGCYDVVELWKGETPAQADWRRKWLASARECGATPTE
jgi:hypothetical protein